MPSNSSVSYSSDATQSCCGNNTSCHAINYLIDGTRVSLLLPSCIFVLFLGYKQWRQQRSFKTASHSDILTYHMVLQELIWLLGAVIFYGSTYFNRLGSKVVGYFLMYIIYFGETSFHVLTCIDRYIAVVYPVLYRQLRGSHGVIIRNVSIFCVWVLSFLLSYFFKIYSVALPIVPFFCYLLSSFAFVFFCSISVLCALFRPSPGAKRGERRQIDPTKQRAFFTVTAITGVLCFWILGLFVGNTLSSFKLLDESVSCMVLKSLVCFNLPSSLVLPLMYLNKVGKLPCCCSTRG